MKEINISLIKKIAKQARKSSRRRQNFNFHKYKDKVQRIINVMEPDTYIRPHKHEKPDKVEVFVALRGKGVAVTFKANGQVKNQMVISEKGPVFGVEIPPKTWHVLIPLTKDAAFFEVIEGPYNERTHKKFAPWAPRDDIAGKKYFKEIKKKLKI